MCHTTARRKNLIPINYRGNETCVVVNILIYPRARALYNYRFKRFIFYFDVITFAVAAAGEPKRGFYCLLKIGAERTAFQQADQ